MRAIGWTFARVFAGAAALVAGLFVAVGPASAAAVVTAPSSGVAGRTIVISGSGWPGFDSVYAYLDQGTSRNYFCSLSTDASGILGPNVCRLPSSLPQGAYTLEVTDSTITVTSGFTLNPGAHVSATSSGAPIGSAAIGQIVYLSGAGYTASSTIASVKVGASAVTTTPASPSVSSQGSFSGVTFTVPTVAAGNYSVTVTDSASQAATFSLSVFAATDTAASSGISGRLLSISGAGWPINDPSVYAYLVQGATQNYFCSLSADGSGGLGPVSCSLPASLPQGSYTLLVTDGSVMVNQPFTLNPGAHASTTSSGAAIASAARGEMVYLTGNGFSAGSTIASVKVGNTSVTTNPASPAVSTQGSFSGVTFTIPNSAKTAVDTVTVTDSASQKATFGLAVYAATDGAASSGVAGRYLAVSGAGWPANETVYAYLVQGTTQNYFCSIGTDSSGDLGPQHCTLPVSLPQGRYALSMSDGSVIANKSFTLNPGAHVATTSSGAAIGSVAAGQTVYLSGVGFSANGLVKSATVGATAVTLSPSNAPIAPQGSFSGVTFTIPPAQPAGAVTVTVKDSHSKAATFGLQVYTVTNTVPASGAAGHNLAISGTGWPLNETVYAYLNQGTSQNYFCSLATDASGTLGPTVCAVPTSLPQGTYTLSLTDGSVISNSSFTLNPSTALTNTSNQPINTAARGSTVNFAGNGFTASSTITSVKIGTTTVATTPSPPLVNAQGSFSGASFVVPSGMSVGNYTVTVTDSSGHQATAPLSVT